MLGLLAVVLVGSVVAASASAEVAGPFWVHRAIGAKGEGEKIEPKAPENLSGSGGKQTLTGTVGTTSIEIASPTAMVKGAIFNNALRGQAKIEIVYTQPTLIKPELKGCTVRVGTANIVVLKAFLAWKWNGTKEQLEEKPQKAQTWDVVTAPTEPAIQKPEPEILKLDETASGSYTSISLSGTGCGTLGGTFAVGGSKVILPEKLTLGEAGFSKELNARTIPEPEKESFKQHFWNGERYLGILVGLEFGGNQASVVGQYHASPAQQEIAVIE